MRLGLVTFMPYQKSYGGITILTAKVKQKSFLNFMVGWYLFLCKEPSKVMRIGHWRTGYRKEQCFHVDLQEFAEIRIAWENFKGTSFLFFSIPAAKKCSVVMLRSVKGLDHIGK